MRQILPIFAIVLALATVTTRPAAQSSPFFPIEDVKPGMTAVGRTVFKGDSLEEFRAEIIGVLKNVIGPRRDLILARLEGGPLATTGVIQGMSGSPVYIDGRLVGAVSYALGSFPKESIAGITPAAEMVDAVNTSTGRANDPSLALAWPADAASVFTMLERVMARATAPIGRVPVGASVIGPSGLASMAPLLRPIGAALVVSGLDPGLDDPLTRALGSGRVERGAGAPTPQAEAGLRPGDPVGISLVRGDLSIGATGTVTHVDGSHVYAFGHPFLNLGPTSFAMTKAHVVTVLPSLDSSLKIATLGDVIGVVRQDRATAIGGTLGPGPAELEVNLTLTSGRVPDRRFAFRVTRDQLLTPLFTYVALLNSLTAYERQAGVLSIAARGTLSFGPDGRVAIDDVFSGETALTAAASAIASPLSAALTNQFRTVVPERLDLEVRTAEVQSGTTIERVWLDTIRPRFGETHQLQVQLQDYRGAKRVISMPVAMPASADGPLTLLVTDASNLTGLEERDLRPGKPTSWNELMSTMNATRRNNRVYVRLLSASTGTVIGGDTLPGLPSSVRSILDADTTVSRVPVARTVIGAWEERLDVAVRGSRELSITLTAR
jgi:hypothetical protein